MIESKEFINARVFSSSLLFIIIYCSSYIDSMHGDFQFNLVLIFNLVIYTLSDYYAGV